jgi:carbon monoxide dehydrogenase subunit G
MKISGEAVLHAPVEQVWQALLDPAVLVRTIPGCERLEETGENRYAMTVTAGVAAVRGTYAGTCALRDLRPHESLVMAVEGSGAPGTIGADVTVRFEERDEDGLASTAVSYDADAVVGGMLGGVGQRMLGSVSKRMAGEFFTAIDRALSGSAPAGASSGSGTFAAAGAAPDVAVGDRAMPAVYVDAPRAGSSNDFLRGIAVGAGLVLAGVVAGVVAGRVGSRPG